MGANENRIPNEVSKPNVDDWGDVSSKECGRVGGQIGGKMVQNMIRLAEQKLIDGQ